MLKLFLTYFNTFSNRFFIKRIARTIRGATYKIKNALPFKRKIDSISKIFNTRGGRIIKEMAFLNPGGAIRQRAEERLVARLHKRTLDSLYQASVMQARLGDAIKRSNKAKLSPKTQDFLRKYFWKLSDKQNAVYMSKVIKNTHLEDLAYLIRTDFRDMKMGRNFQKKINDNDTIGLFTNSSWLVGYKRGTPNGMLFTNTSSFTVQGLNDNMIDRMVVAPGAGKYLWNTLWLHKRRNKPDKAIKRTFSSAFMAEYTKRQQAFKRG